MSDVTIFAPSPTLTVTVEEHGGGPDIHVHAGGQGVWQARMLLRLGASVTMCRTLAGEVGRMLRHLLEDEGIGVAGLERPGKGSAYVHDRRGGERRVIAETEGEPLARHDLGVGHIRLAVEDLPNTPEPGSDAALLAEGWVTLTGLDPVSHVPLGFATR